jgi:hypothetical protein
VGRSSLLNEFPTGFGCSFRRATASFVAMTVALLGAPGAPPRCGFAQQTLYRNTLSASQNTLGNVSGWSRSSIAAGATPTSVTASDTLVFSNYWSPGLLSGVSLWVDAADASTITTGTVDSITVVTQWLDKSGRGNTMTRLGGSVGPVLYSGTSRIGRPMALRQASAERGGS